MHYRKDAVRLLRAGRSGRGPIYGAYYKLASGELIYMAWRKEAEIFRSGKPSASEALRDGVACWALDEETLSTLRSEGIKFAGIWVVQSGDKYITALENFFDPVKANMMNYEARGGALQRYLPIQHFRRTTGKARVR